jgi:hypothetical protein
MKFLADGMLGKLVRWLRLAGHDALYVGDLELPPEDDQALLSLAAKENRTLLTRDLQLYRGARRAGLRSILIPANELPAQLVELSKRCGCKLEIRPEDSRCPMCNGELELAPNSEIEGKIPVTVFKSNKEFWRCKRCGKIYWKGKHWGSITKIVEEYQKEVTRC